MEYDWAVARAATTADAFNAADGRATRTLLVLTTSKAIRDVTIDSGMETAMPKQMDAWSRSRSHFAEH